MCVLRWVKKGSCVKQDLGVTEMRTCVFFSSSDVDSTFALDARKRLGFYFPHLPFLNESHFIRKHYSSVPYDTSLELYRLSPTPPLLPYLKKKSKST